MELTIVLLGIIAYICYILFETFSGVLMRLDKNQNKTAYKIFKVLILMTNIILLFLIITFLILLFII